MSIALRMAALTALPLILAAQVPVQAHADTLTARAKVSAVTLFPQGAAVTRSAEISGASGRHQIILPGLPYGLDLDSLRIEAEGISINSMTLQQQRAIPDTAPEDPRITEARAEVEAAAAALRGFDANIAGLFAEAQAAQEAVAFLTSLSRSDAPLGADPMRIASEIATRSREARLAALSAELEAQNLAHQRRPLEEAEHKARAALDVLLSEDNTGATLVLEVEMAGRQGRLDMTAIDTNAGWAPVYDLRLDTDTGTLLVDRGVTVRQATGEDWTGVALTLSTARPTGQVAPSDLSSQILQLASVAYRIDGLAAPAPLAIDRAASAEADDGEGYYAPEPVILAAERVGMVMNYTFPQVVDIRDRADALRLAMDSQSLEAELHAEANAAQDQTAYLVAEAVNTGEPLLPGEAALYVDGVRIGRTTLGLVTQGDTLEAGFGAIDGLTVERRTPRRESGSRGFVTRVNGSEAETQIVVRNLTERDWQLVLRDRVPVSETAEITVDWKADPAPARIDPDSRRGILEWDFQIAPGAEEIITKTVIIGWPANDSVIGLD